MDVEPSKLARPEIPEPRLVPPVVPPLSPLDRVAAVPAKRVEVHEAARVVLKTEADSSGTEKDETAALNPRLAAGMIDLAVGLGILLVVSWVLPGFLKHLAGPALVVYLIGRDSLPLLGGQSFGKRVMGLRVVTREGLPITKDWERAVLRNLSLVIPLMGLVELYFLLTRDGGVLNGQRLGDQWARTQVVVVPACSDDEGSS